MSGNQAEWRLNMVKKIKVKGSKAGQKVTVRRTATVTLKTPAMDLNALYRKIVDGVLAQSGPSMAANGAQCMYRMTTHTSWSDVKETRKCAAGQVIPDNMYKPAMEYTSCTSGLVRAVWNKLGFGPEHVRLIAALQVAHDHAAVNATRGIYEDKYQVDIFKQQFRLAARCVAMAVGIRDWA